MEKYDAVIILGHSWWPYGPSSRQIKRMKASYELWKNGQVRYLITTGGRSLLFNPTSRSLGQLTKQYLQNLGVQEDQILVDNLSLDTWENAEFAIRLMEEKKLNSAIVVTSSSHMGRAKRIFEDLCPEGMRFNFLISDRFSGIWWTLWDYLWHAGGWGKYWFMKIIKPFFLI